MDAAAPSPPLPIPTASATPMPTPLTADFAPPILTRELITPRGSVVPAHKILRVLAKLPIAVAEGLFSPSEAGLLTHLCNLMLGCTRDARANPHANTNANNAELSQLPANG